jgi:hypothetical protein
MTDLELVTQVEEDTDPQARVAAARALLESRGYKADRALAERIVAAAERESSGEPPPGELSESSLAYKLGEVVASIELGPTGLWSRVRPLLRTHERVELRLAIIRYILPANIEAELLGELIDELKALVGDPHPAVRVQALDALQIDLAFPAVQHAGLFQLFVDHLPNPDPDVASRALQNLGGWINLRPDLFDIFLAFLEPLVGGGGVVPYRCMWGAARLLDANSEATPEQLTRALTVAKTIARNPNNGYDRALVFRGIGERGAAEGRSLLDELKKDPDVGADARSVLKDLTRAARARS